jgi:hypothetical protein
VREIDDRKPREPSLEGRIIQAIVKDDIGAPITYRAPNRVAILWRQAPDLLEVGPLIDVREIRNILLEQKANAKAKTRKAW